MYGMQRISFKKSSTRTDRIFFFFTQVLILFLIDIGSKMFNSTFQQNSSNYVYQLGLYSCHDALSTSQEALIDTAEVKLEDGIKRSVVQISLQ